MEVTRAFARYVAELSYDRIPEDVRKIARRALIDTIGCAIAGSVEPAARIAREMARQDGGAPRATVLAAGNDGASLKLPPQAAAMVNAIAGHALDYDDVNPMGHPSVPVVFTALAAAEDVGASGRDLIAAYVAGVEVETKIMRAFTESHYLHGWHSTSTLGVLGAAAAASKLYKLSAEQIAIAFGIAASQACGLRQNFGTMTKPYHPGHASWAGITSARLARDGFTADPAIFEAQIGYLPVFAAGPFDASRAVGALDRWTLVDPGLSVKKYPCCYCTHPSLDAALKMREQHKIDPEQIVSIHAQLSKFFLSPLIHHRPSTGLEGKFSLEYALAAAMLDGKVVLATFTDEMVQRAQARALIEKVSVAPHEGAGDDGLRASFVRLKIELSGGRTFVEELVEPRGTASNPLSDEELADKFRDCWSFARRGGSADSALDLLRQVDHLERLDRFTAALA
jgi:2-methylcitrate dehydratase PrpD